MELSWGLWLSVCGVIAACTTGLQPFITVKLSILVRDWLFGRKKKNWSRYVAYTFGQLFDRAFACRRIRPTSKCPVVLVPGLAKAAAFSYGTLFLIWLHWYFHISADYTIEFHDIGTLLYFDSTRTKFYFAQSILIGVLVPALLNFVIDYFSFVETRFLIRFAPNSKTATCVILVLDLILTSALFIVISTIGMYVCLNLALTAGLSVQETEFRHVLDVSISNVLTVLTYIFPIPEATIGTITSWYSFAPESAQQFILMRNPWDFLNGTFFLSTFLTSVWLWIYVVLTFTMRFGPFVGPFTGRIAAYIRVREYPLVALNIYGIALFTLVYFLLCAIF